MCPPPPILLSILTLEQYNLWLWLLLLPGREVRMLIPLKSVELSIISQYI